MKKKILLTIVFLLVLFQFVRPNFNNGEAESNRDITHCLAIPDKVMHILKRSCYDCHSNHTNYPWYGHVNPVGLWLDNHVQEGKAVFNFTNFSMYSKVQAAHILKRIAEATQKGEVPLPSYLLIHKEARLSHEEVQQVVTWATASYQKVSSINQ